MVRLPNPPVRTGYAAFTAHGSRNREFMVTSISSGFHRVHDVQLARSLSTLYRFPTLFLRALPKPGCRHPDSATKPDVKLSLHPAPQWCGSCHENHRTDGSRDCLSALHTYLRTGPGSCHMQVYSPPSLPHHRSHVSLSWTLPQAFASWEIPPQRAHAVDHLLHLGGERS